METNKFNINEKILVNTMSVTLGLRLMAMMIVMPLMSVYAKRIVDSTPFLSGLALGAFGLTQAIFQFPFGKWSDKYGRKRMVVLGMLLLLIGLIIAGLAKNIYLLIIGRAIQGCGGINAVVYAWVGDTIDEKKRNKAMGILGVVGGFAAIGGFVAGPLLYKVITVPSIFYICAAFVAVACIFLCVIIKDNKGINKVSNNDKVSVVDSIKNKNILRLNFAVFLMSYTMTALFFIFPLLVENTIGVSDLWKVLVPATVVGIIVMRIMVKKVSNDNFNIMGILGFLLILVCGILMLFNNSFIKSLGMIVYMGGYLYLTTMLPSSVTKLGKKEVMGQVTGIFNMSQYIGAFFGGVVSGILWNI